jgi:nucleoid DNA-binding protein
VAITKKNLIDRIAESTGTQHVLAKRVVQHLLDEITSELAKGNRLEFRDFGVFETKTTPARMAQNPRTLKKIEVPAKRRVVFRAGSMMKEGLNGKLVDGRVTASPAPKQTDK